MSSTITYDDGQQKSTKQGDDEPVRFHEVTSNSHQALDSKDERSIANKLARATEVNSNQPCSTNQLQRLLIYYICIHLAQPR